MKAKSHSSPAALDTCKPNPPLKSGVGSMLNQLPPPTPNERDTPPVTGSSLSPVIVTVAASGVDCAAAMPPAATDGATATSVTAANRAVLNHETLIEVSLPEWTRSTGTRTGARKWLP